MTPDSKKQGKNLRSTRIYVEFPTMPSLADRPSYIDIYQEQYHHEIAVLSFNRTSERRFKDIPTGLPVQVTWAQGRRKKVWIGYVSHVEKTVQGSFEQPMSIHCVGASYPLKERATRTFQNMTVPEVAKLIANEFGMKLVSDNHPTRFSQLSMTGHSYWEWLVEHAKKIGYALYVDGTTIYLERFDRVIARKQTDTALLFFDGKYLPPRSRHVDRTLHYFKVLKGDGIETNQFLRTNKVTAGVSPYSTSITSKEVAPNQTGIGVREITSDVLFKEYRNDVVAQDPDIARELAKAAASMSRFNIPAKVKCIGDVRISPFVPVQILGTGTKTDGMWITQKVRHNIRSNGEYDIEAVVLTDGTGANNSYGARVNVVNQVGYVNTSEALREGGILKPDSKFYISSGVGKVSPAGAGFTKDRARWKAGK